MSRLPGVVTLSADTVGQPGNLPRHCSRHGLPAVRQQDFVLQSKVKLEGNRALLQSNVIGMSERLSDYGKKVRTADVKGWPLCRKCTRSRALWLAVASVMFFGGLATFVGSLVVAAVADDMQWLGGVAFAAFAVLPLAAFPFSLGSLPRLTGARTSPDGASVIIEQPSQAFAAELPPAQ
ncbi:hypothetical protein [Haloechinothrix halophila]|uniref:hypothetical protein n=1 Tax=Haloechinothrix halophila TaxID=1069073 RepID=UPI0005516E36|nr:hypothetical protein [Haloechinothrix halophila]